MIAAAYAFPLDESALLQVLNDSLHGPFGDPQLLLNRVPLGYEIWRQLNGFPPIVSDDEPDSQKDSKKPKKVKLPKA